MAGQRSRPAGERSHTAAGTRLTSTTRPSRPGGHARPLQISPVIAHQQVPDIAGDREAVALPRREPVELPRPMIGAGVDFRADHLQGDQQGLRGVGAGAPACGLFRGPVDFKPADPVDGGFLRRKDTDRYLDISGVGASRHSRERVAIIIVCSPGLVAP